MPRIPLIEDNADPRIAAIYVALRSGGHAGFPNLYRLLAHAPAMLEAWTRLAWPLRTEAKTPRALRELMILRGAQIMGADYEWTHHAPMALAAGVTREQIDALELARERRLFGDRAHRPAPGGRNHRGARRVGRIDHAGARAFQRGRDRRARADLFLLRLRRTRPAFARRSAGEVAGSPKDFRAAGAALDRELIAAAVYRGPSNLPHSWRRPQNRGM